MKWTIDRVDAKRGRHACIKMRARVCVRGRRERRDVGCSGDKILGIPGSLNDARHDKRASELARSNARRHVACQTRTTVWRSQTHGWNINAIAAGNVRPFGKLSPTSYRSWNQQCTSLNGSCHEISRDEDRKEKIDSAVKSGCRNGEHLITIKNCSFLKISHAQYVFLLRAAKSSYDIMFRKSSRVFFESLFTYNQWYTYTVLSVFDHSSLLLLIYYKTQKIQLCWHDRNC